MADGIRLGGAFYEISADAASLITALRNAEQQSQKSAQAIAQATGIPEKSVQRLANTYLREQKRMGDASARETLRIIKGHNDAAAAAEKAAERQAKAAQQANAGFVSLAKGIGGFVTAAAGVSVGAATISTAMSRVAESTQKAAQAQFALNALYGQSAPIIKAQADALAEMSGRSRTEATEAATAVANLGRQYGLTFEQQEKVLQISANLAAIRGIPLAEATERVASALRGEAEAAEYLGQVLNSDAVKAMARMTDEQRKHFETLGPLEKAQIVFGKLVEDNADLMGKAAERANSSVGAYDKFTGSVDNLSVSIGEKLAPATASALGFMSKLVDATDKWIKSIDQQKVDAFIASLARAQLNNFGLPGLIAGALIPTGSGRQPADPLLSGPDPGMPGGTNPGLTSPATAQAIEEARRQRDRDAEAERTAIARLAESRKRAIDDIAKAQEAAFRREADLRDKAIEREKIRLTVEMNQRLKALDEREKATIRAIEAEGRAEQKAFEEKIQRFEQERDAQIAAAEEAADRVRAAVEAEERRLDREREQQDRARDAERRQADQQRDDERRREDQARDDERRQQDQDRDAARRTADRETEDARRRQDQAAEEAHEKTIRRIERERDARVAAVEEDIRAFEKSVERKLRGFEKEADKARRTSEQTIRGIERQAEAEDDRHRAAMRALDEEQDARLALLDTQLKALDAADKSADAAERIARIQKRVSDAQRAATRARGTGTPQQIAEARVELTQAIREGNEIAVANARERLAQLAGQGNEAIQKADEELAEAQEDLRKEGVENQRDAERDKLKAAQDAIRKEIDDRKRAEEETSRLRKRGLDEEKDAERQKLAAAIDGIEKKKTRLQDAAKEELRLRRSGLDAEKEAARESIAAERERYEGVKETRAQERLEFDRAREDTRRAEDEERRYARQEQDRLRQDERLAQDRLRQEERRAQDIAREDERKAQDQALKDRLTDVSKALELEREVIRQHYNGPNGLIPQAQAAQEAARLAHQQRLEREREQFAAEKAAIKDVYRNDAKTGLLDYQDQAAENNRTKLGEQLTDLTNWREIAGQLIDDNKGKWTQLAEAIERTNELIRNAPTPRVPVPVTSGPRPTGADGRPVQGPGFDDDYSQRPGSGPGPNNPPSYTPSPAPSGGISGEESTGEVDVDPGRFRVAFGFNQPYDNPFNAAIPNHRGVDLVIRGADNGGRGLPVGAFRGGTVVALTSEANGGNGIILRAADGLYDRYFHFDEINVGQGAVVRRGQRIGVLGASGTEGFPHLHYEVSRSPSGDPMGDLIDPTPYMRGRDSGYLFRQPTLTIGLRDGERNIIAERRPEYLMGGAATAAAMSRPVIGAAPPSRDYMTMGAVHAEGLIGGSGGYTEGDTSIVVNGVGLSEVAATIERRQRVQQMLRGRVRRF